MLTKLTFNGKLFTELDTTVVVFSSVTNKLSQHSSISDISTNRTYETTPYEYKQEQYNNII